MIQLDSITFDYGNPPAIFQDFSWGIQRGDTWAVLGPSGCGKSTLLYLLAGLRFPKMGQVLVDGKQIFRPRPHTGLIIQEYGLLPWATVRENALLGLQIRGFYGPDGTHAPMEIQSSDNIDHWLDRLRLLPHAKKYPSQLSGGQRQRTAIARTLALQPDLLLMDEPFSSLDAPTRESLQNLTLELQSEENLTLVIVTHTIEEAAILGQKILLLGNPPNAKSLAIENPGAKNTNFRGSDEYVGICRELRERMDSQEA